ncbi:hypothetical protein RHSIM_Rhsim03G0104200 [Rhododendron simsii]|uniref:Uncharacterized protein n=1 Tax=Rhododendron simsii TaxID=118357 RepID=A0A834LSB4_RHOSS|nr:hypothetical protein RHSIM_Rhsim03G0104200 [Rhododendron simsii]
MSRQQGGTRQLAAEAAPPCVLRVERRLVNFEKRLETIQEEGDQIIGHLNSCCKNKPPTLESSNSKESKHQLRWPATEGRRKSTSVTVDYSPAEKLRSEEFRQTVEDFIARHLSL